MVGDKNLYESLQKKVELHFISAENKEETPCLKAVNQYVKFIWKSAFPDGKWIVANPGCLHGEGFIEDFFVDWNN